MTGRFEFLQMRWQEQSQNLCFFSERQQNVTFFKIDKTLDLSCFGLALTDHFIFINVYEKDLTSVGSNHQSISLVLVAKGSDVGRRTHFFDGDVSVVVEISMPIPIEDSHLAVV